MDHLVVKNTAPISNKCDGDFFFSYCYNTTLPLFCFTVLYASSAIFSVFVNTTSNYEYSLSQVPSHVSAVLACYAHLVIYIIARKTNPRCYCYNSFPHTSRSFGTSSVSKTTNAIKSTFSFVSLHNEQPLLPNVFSMPISFFIIASEVLVSCVAAIPIGLSFPSCLTFL